jgi:hypothetical protein
MKGVSLQSIGPAVIMVGAARRRHSCFQTYTNEDTPCRRGKEPKEMTPPRDQHLRKWHPTFRSHDERGDLVIFRNASYRTVGNCMVFRVLTKYRHTKESTAFFL